MHQAKASGEADDDGHRTWRRCTGRRRTEQRSDDGLLHWDGSTCKRARIALAPDKTDPTGEQGHKVFLPYAQDADINAAAAIAHMLALDPTESGESDQTPLFRDTRGGWVWTRSKTARQSIRRILTNAASCLHLPTAQRAKKASQ